MQCFVRTVTTSGQELIELEISFYIVPVNQMSVKQMAFDQMKKHPLKADLNFWFQWPILITDSVSNLTIGP